MPLQLLNFLNLTNLNVDSSVFAHGLNGMVQKINILHEQDEKRNHHPIAHTSFVIESEVFHWCFKGRRGRLTAGWWTFRVALNSGITRMRRRRLDGMLRNDGKSTSFFSSVLTVGVWSFSILLMYSVRYLRKLLLGSKALCKKNIGNYSYKLKSYINFYTLNFLVLINIVI